MLECDEVWLLDFEEVCVVECGTLTIVCEDDQCKPWQFVDLCLILQPGIQHKNYAYLSNCLSRNDS